jgi:hypothetical protein
MGFESGNMVCSSKCLGLLCFITVVAAHVVVSGCEKAGSAGCNLEPTAQAETAQQASPIPPASPLADPKSLKQFGVPVKATRAAVPADNPQTPEKIAIGEKLFLTDACRLTEQLPAVHATIRRTLFQMEESFPSVSKGASVSATLPRF